MERPRGALGTLATALGVALLVAVVVVPAAYLIANRPGAADDPDQLEAATPRGLAQALIEHADSLEVSRPFGSDEGKVIDASIDVRRGADQATLSVIAYPPGLEPLAEPGDQRCIPEGGSAIVSCRINRPHGPRSVMERLPGDPDAKVMPYLTGRVTRDDGSSLLIMVHGSPGLIDAAFIDDLLADDRIGWRTTASYNAQGEDLDDFGKTEHFMTAEGLPADEPIWDPPVQPTVTASP